MNSEIYKRAMSYERFIRRVFDCPRGSKNGAEASIMSNAILIEQGSKASEHLGSFDKQFNRVKEFIILAFESSHGNGLIFDEVFIEQQIQLTKQATNTGQLDSILTEAWKYILE
jgi:hypothetical protein